MAADYSSTKIAEAAHSISSKQVLVSVSQIDIQQRFRNENDYRFSIHLSERSVRNIRRDVVDYARKPFT